MDPVIVVHLGAGSRAISTSTAEKAGKAGLEILLKGGLAIDAVEQAIMVMEDEDGHNAGTGCKIRLDGSVQMDASLMDSRGKLGVVACITNVKNPIMVARKVAETPHLVLAGEGATNFARNLGFPNYDPRTISSIERYEKLRERIKKGDLPKYAERWREFAEEMIETVGAVAVDKSGTFATGSSTGGTSLSIEGRIGDTPLIGCGFYAGKKGAVSVTGIGEYIIERMLSKWVYDRIDSGKSAQEAAKAGVALFDDHIPTGIIAVSSEGYGVTSNAEMAYWINDGQ
jgi:L-asparaginase/beta-aspartyl-peptidase (threonine type)